MIIRRVVSKIRNKIISRKFHRCGNNFTIGRAYSIINPSNIDIGNNFSAGDNCYLQTWLTEDNKEKKPYLSIGDNVSVMGHVQFSCANRISIGDGVLMGDNVLITDNYHGEINRKQSTLRPLDRNIVSKGAVFIGENVWIGRNVCIMPNVSIGNGAIIGANAVVTRDVPELCVAGGVPADVIKTI